MGIFLYNIKTLIRYLYKELFFPSIKFTKMQEGTFKQLDSTLTIFVHYNENNIIDDSDIKYIKELSKISSIIFVTNSKLTENELTKILSFVITIKERDNIGYDFGAWKDVILNSKEIILSHKRLILANNSVFASACNLNNIVNTMNQSNIDFWGITAFSEHYLFRSEESKILGLKKVPQHIQSYFICFNFQAQG